MYFILHKIFLVSSLFNYFAYYVISFFPNILDRMVNLTVITHTRVNLHEYTDSSFSGEDSIILRYHKSFAHDINLDLLKSISIKEGCRIIGPLNYKNTNIYILDMASLMADGNFKSSVSCVAVARSMEQGAQGLVACSSGNTGTAIARYTKNQKFKSYIFIPEISLNKLDFSVIDDNIHKVKIINKPEWEVHAYAKNFAEENGLPFVPSISHQFEANSCRTMFTLEYMVENDITFDWTSQAISGGHGPLGFYKKFYSLINEGLQINSLPGFIGVQQSSVCPMYNAWIDARDTLTEEDINLYPNDIMEPTLYSTRPDSNYNYLYKIIKNNGGTFYCIDHPEYIRLEKTMLNIINSAGIKLKTKRIQNDAVITEKAGILSGMGILKAIEDGLILPSENVLLTFTGTTESPII